MLQTYHLADEFTDAIAERTLLASIAQRRTLYWEYLDLLTDAFAVETEPWTQLVSDLLAERTPQLPADWQPAVDARPLAERLADLRQRRLIAGVQERMAVALHSEKPAAELLVTLEEELLAAQSAVRELRAGVLLWGTDLAGEYLQLAEQRRTERLESGKTIAGIATGLRTLDHLLNGLNTGLYILAGAPGAGKTTLAVQLALHAAHDRIPVVYVTYENSPQNLVGKLLCARAGLSPSDVERGFGNVPALRVAQFELSAELPRLAFVEGTSRLTVPEVRAKALHAMHRHHADRCLIVFDYLQRAAHGKGYDGLRQNVSALAGELRELANRLQSPVLALSSQSRAGGNYGNGGGSASLDSLKESGDLEYSADAILFLKQSMERHASAPARAMDLVLAKNRFGDIGTVPLIFRADTGCLREEGHRP